MGESLNNAYQAVGPSVRHGRPRERPAAAGGARGGRGGRHRGARGLHRQLVVQPRGHTPDRDARTDDGPARHHHGEPRRRAGDVDHRADVARARAHRRPVGRDLHRRGFEGQPVLLEFFAVWCPVCTAQQKAVREALAHRPELVPISLNVDPNEGEDQVREHVQAHDGFDWRYAVASSTMTHRLIQEFGSVIANPPAAPVVRVCPDGTASLLDERGAKPAEALLASFDAC